MRFVGYVIKDAGRIIRNPRKLLKLSEASTRRRLIQLAKARLFQAGVSEDWQSDGNDNLKNRQYNSYEQYLQHQKMKIGFLNLSDYDKRFREALAVRIGEMDIVDAGSRVICLAARIGSEVKAFKDNGCFAVGIDLNPGEENQHVLHGDFHNLQFPDGSADFIYSNSLDHAFDIERIVNEVTRVLRPGGIFLVEAIRGTDDGVEPQEFESFFWDSIEDLIELFESLDLQLVGKLEFDQPWKGIQLQLKNVRVAEPSSEEPEHASA